MKTVKFLNSSYRPKQLLHWCAEEEEFVEVYIHGLRADGTATYHTSSQDFGFLSMVYFGVMKKITEIMVMTGKKR